MRGVLHDRIVARFAAERRSRRLTQAQLAQRLGRSTSFVFRYETGARYLDVAEFIARALDVDPYAAAGRSGGLTGGHAARRASHPLPARHGRGGTYPGPARGL